MPLRIALTKFQEDKCTLGEAVETVLSTLPMIPESVRQFAPGLLPTSTLHLSNPPSLSRQATQKRRKT